MTEKRPTVIRANSRDLEQIFALFAAAQELRGAQQTMERRARAIPGGWRDLRLIRTLLDKLVVNLVGTLQPEKLASMKRMLPRMHYKVVCGTEATATLPDEVVLAHEDLDTLVRYAHESCKLCMGANCRSCPLGRALDRVMLRDRGDACWGMMDLGEAED